MRPCYLVVDSPISLTTDVSNIAIGAVLEQRVGQVWKSLAFFSKQLRTPELSAAHLTVSY